MTILPVIAVCATVLLIAYLTYGRLVVRWLGIDPSRTTPAVAMEDGLDYVPASVPVVLGGHFTAIAAAGPIVGPILAGLAFGWMPALLWIIVGSILIGGVHDSGALFASIRHRASSITQVVREQMSGTAYLSFLMFVWLSLIYVIIAFADVTAGTFAKFQRIVATIDGQPTEFAINGGAVVIGATAYLVLSVVMGLFLRFTRIPWWILLCGCVAILTIIIWKSPDLAMWLSTHGLKFMDTARTSTNGLTKGWDQALLVYCFFASIVPMWLLLQPRGVIGATFLYAALFFGILGTLIGGWSAAGSLAIHWPAFKGFVVNAGTSATPDIQFLFPFLFITIACGACSGFHSVVASGTTSKQVRRESDIRPIAYGAMLLEAMVAVFALSCVMVLVPGTTSGTPDAIYARGIGNFMNICGIPMQFAIGFGLLAFSSFVFDTLDVCTRLGRYVFQELTGLRGLVGGACATILTLAGPSIYLVVSPPGSFRSFWTIFGTSNQLLAALTLVGVSVWLWRTGRPVIFALLPAYFMLASTGTALVLNFRKFMSDYRLVPKGASGAPLVVNMCIAAVLLMLAVLVVLEAVRVWRLSRVRPAFGVVSREVA